MNRIPLAVVGLNWGRKVILQEILDGPATPHFELAGVCAKEKEIVKTFSGELGVKPYFCYEDLLRDERVPAIALMTGPNGRAEMIRKAVESGKHVMTTKPIERDPEAALAVLRRAKELGRVVHLNSPGPRPSPDVQKILKWQADFRLGQPIAARADIWANYREEPDGSWYDDPMQCPAAPIFRLGIYLINDLIRLFGRVHAVSVMTSRIFTGRPTPDNAQLALRFDNGAIANIFSSFCIDDTQWWLSSLTLNYAKGTIYRNVGPAKGKNPRENPELSLVTRVGEDRVVHRHVADGTTEDYQWDAFHAAIMGKKLKDELASEQVVEALRVIRAMERAEKSGREELVSISADR